MTVWVELKNGTKHTYKNVNRIVERSGKMEIRGGAGWGDKLLVAYDKLQIKALGNSTTLPASRIQKIL
jgi:hypothetical protein